MSDFPKDCPHCLSDFKGEPIPDRHRHLYGGASHYSRLVGIEVPGEYDGTLYYVCPDCGRAIPRDFGPRRQLSLSSLAHAERVNARIPRALRGMCPKCGRSIAVGEGGRLVSHDAQIVPSTPNGPTVEPCAGSGTPFDDTPQ